MNKILLTLSWTLLLFPFQVHAKPSPYLERKYSDVKAFLQKIATDNKGRAETIIVGDSDSKDKILGLKVGNGPVRNLVVATHHGNEYGSTEVALAFAESVAKSPIEGQTTFVIPVLNIQGYNNRSRWEPTNNGYRADPNRDYPNPCGSEGPFRLKSTKALAQFIENEKIVNSATLHTYYPAVVYPWGFSTHDLETAYPEIFLALVKDATQESGYQIGNSSEVIYPADGTFEDYAFLQHGVWSILFELGFSHSPSQSEIQKMIELNVPGLRRMLANAPKEVAKDHGFKGSCDYRLKALDRHDE